MRFSLERVHLQVFLLILVLNRGIGQVRHTNYFCSEFSRHTIISGFYCAFTLKKAGGRIPTLYAPCEKIGLFHISSPPAIMRRDLQSYRTPDAPHYAPPPSICLPLDDLPDLFLGGCGLPGDLTYFTQLAKTTSSNNHTNQKIDSSPASLPFTDRQRANPGCHIGKLKFQDSAHEQPPALQTKMAHEPKTRAVIPNIDGHTSHPRFGRV